MKSWPSLGKVNGGRRFIGVAIAIYPQFREAAENTGQ